MNAYNCFLPARKTCVCLCKLAESLGPYIKMVKLFHKRSVFRNDRTQQSATSSSPWTTCLYGPNTFTPDQKWFKYMLLLHICLQQFRQETISAKHYWRVNITLPFVSDFFSSLFLILFDSHFQIGLRFADSIWLIFLNFTHHLQFYSIFPIHF